MMDTRPQPGESTTPEAFPSAFPQGPVRNVCAALRQVMVESGTGDVVRPQPNDRREELLRAYRRFVLEQVHHDAEFNLAEVRRLLKETSARGGADLAATPLGSGLAARMDADHQRVVGLNPYADGRSEFQWWLAVNQFYLDGLLLADRLLAADRGKGLRRWRGPRRWREYGDLKMPGVGQGLVTLMQVTVPDLFRVSPFGTYLPLLRCLAAHHVFASKPFCLSELLASTRGWIRRGGFAQLRGSPGETVRFAGLEHLHESGLLDPATGRTRHNVIIAVSHRLGYLDWPLFFEPLRKLQLGLWLNNAFYGPRGGRKIARDRYAIAIRGDPAPPLEISLSQTADLLIEGRVPVVIFVDGGQPPVFYGQQMRVKRGVRLAVNETIRRSAGTGRRTYVLPMSLNDPVGFVQGLQRVMCVRFHRPILLETACDLRRPMPGAPSETGESGDPLINHLEALFLLETSHATAGLPRPRIISAVRRREHHREPLLKRGFQTSLADLARQAAADLG